MMKNKGYIFSIVFILCFTLAACREGNGAGVNVDDMPLTSVYHNGKKMTLSLAMNRADVEELLGTGTELDVQVVGQGEGEQVLPPAYQRSQPYAYGEGEDTIVVIYRQDVVIDIRLGAPEYKRSNWRLKYGLAPGGSMEQLIQAYGEAVPLTYPSTDLIGMEYFYDESFAPVEDPTAVVYKASFWVDPQDQTIVYCAVGAYTPLISSADPEMAPVLQGERDAIMANLGYDVEDYIYYYSSDIMNAVTDSAFGEMFFEINSKTGDITPGFYMNAEGNIIVAVKRDKDGNEYAYTFALTEEGRWPLVQKRDMSEG